MIVSRGMRGWDLPISEEFFRAVRDVNAPLPRDRQLRVLLGDPPIDWGTVRTRDIESKRQCARFLQQPRT